MRLIVIENQLVFCYFTQTVNLSECPCYKWLHFTCRNYKIHKLKSSKFINTQQRDLRRILNESFGWIV